MIPEGLYLEVEKYVNSPEGKKRGFTTPAGYIQHAVRKELGLV